MYSVPGGEDLKLETSKRNNKKKLPDVSYGEVWREQKLRSVQNIDDIHDFYLKSIIWGAVCEPCKHLISMHCEFKFIAVLLKMS